ncbi:hypothetical protein HAX54_005830 [Datura stramonium]|uniref:Uncharacterized protein n=1 Tax=Datura stramonium TaxID=4076 RepID=A0ABS8TA64_DATST|nr:hypothetical protein [Datura stramonium]
MALVLLLVVVVFGGDDFLSRKDFPASMVFGSASSAYQVEGAALQDGRTPTIWDTFSHAGAYNGATGDEARMSLQIQEDVANSCLINGTPSHGINHMLHYITMIYQVLEDEYGVDGCQKIMYAGYFPPIILRKLDIPAYVLRQLFNRALHSSSIGIAVTHLLSDCTRESTSQLNMVLWD